MKRWTVLICGVALAGCYRGVLAGAEGPPYGMSKAGLLSGAGEEDETVGPDDFVQEPAELGPAPEEAAIERPEAQPKHRRFGLRMGCLAFLGATERKVNPAFILGGSYAMRPREQLPLLLEVGLDAVPIATTASGDYDSTVVLARAAARWLFREERTVVACATAGVSGLFEWTEGEGLDSRADNSATLVDVGAGILTGSGRWEGHVSYSFLLGSQNVRGIIMLSAGMRF